MHQPDSLEGDKRCLFGRLGDDGVAGGERSGDLADENRKRKVPRTDADENAASAQPVTVLLPGRTGEKRPLTKMPARLRRVVAAEVGRLAHLGDAVVERLAALVHEERDQAVAMCLDQIGSTL